jgi:hypothetical protein
LSATFNEGIFKEFFSGRSLFRVLAEALLDEVLAVVAYFRPCIRVESDGIVNNCFSCLLICLLNKRREIINDVVGKDTESPDVYLGISKFFFENFRRAILEVF